jgi:putative transposase
MARAAIRAPEGRRSHVQSTFGVSIMPQSYTQLYYHLVFSTKSREPWLDATIRERLFPFIGGGIRDEGGAALIVNGVEDHVHILARLRQDKALSDVLRSLKADSSSWIHKEFPSHRSFAWQAGYGAFTVSASQTPVVRAYIANQQEHHRKMTFQEEFRALLRAHGIEFDEKYLWD